MSFKTISQCANDQAFIARVVGCAADEGANPPESAAAQTKWAICAADDVEAAYESALAANNPDPGGDESVITDGMILAAFQAHWTPPAPPA
jgi:hypothetical protein